MKFATKYLLPAITTGAGGRGFSLRIRRPPKGCRACSRFRSRGLDNYDKISSNSSPRVPASAAVLSLLAAWFGPQRLVFFTHFLVRFLVFYFASFWSDFGSQNGPKLLPKLTKTSSKTQLAFMSVKIKIFDQNPSIFEALDP